MRGEERWAAHFTKSDSEKLGNLSKVYLILKLFDSQTSKKNKFLVLLLYRECNGQVTMN